METMDLTAKIDLLARVEAALDSIRGFLEADGGNVELVDVDEDMTVTIRLLGACSVCSMSQMTMKAGIEDSIRKSVPEVKAVVAVE